jgi:hypothetical protein
MQFLSKNEFNSKIKEDNFYFPYYHYELSKKGDIIRNKYVAKVIRGNAYSDMVTLGLIDISDNSRKARHIMHLYSKYKYAMTVRKEESMEIMARFNNKFKKCKFSKIII